MKGIRRVGTGLCVISAVLISYFANSAPKRIPQPPSSPEAALQAIISTPPIPADEAPKGGTFYSAKYGDKAPPMPSNMGLPVWNLGDNIFLINDLETDILSGSSLESANLSMMTLSGPPSPGGGGGTNGGGSTNVFVYTFPKDGLWIELTNVSNGYASGVLHHPTNLVYSILTSTDLSSSAWNIEQALVPGTNTNAMPFSIATLNRSNLFIQAHDWTRDTHGGNVTPDWWFWYYFGTTNLTDNTLDSTGNTLLHDYQNGLDPNVISFSVSITNNHVKGMFPVQMNIATGIPKYYSVAIDDTNAAAWWNYSGPNISMSFASDGWHTVYVGLRGSPSGTITWKAKRIRADLIPPTLGVTSPSGTVEDTIIQLCGFSSKPLASISLDITNSTGARTNQRVVLTGQVYNTNTIEYTTNFWQCYDLALAMGINRITLHATDLAGNSVLLTTNITCVGHTTPPSLTLRWPQNGMRINSSKVTIQGQVDDPAASVNVTFVDTMGKTNISLGRVGRDGVFWVENIPLAAATNAFSLMATNASGQNSTNFTLTRSAVGLTINPVHQGDTNVSGTIGVSGYSIWVNGVKATDNGDGAWTASGASTGAGGGQTQASAIPNSDNAGNGTGGTPNGGTGNPSSDQSVNAEFTQEAPYGLYQSGFHENFHADTGLEWNGYQYVNTESIDIMDWEDGQGGHFYQFDYLFGDPWSSDYIIPATSWPQIPEYLPLIELTQGRYTGPSHYGDCVDTIDSDVKLATGGPLGSKAQRLWRIAFIGVSYENEDDYENHQGTPIPPEQIYVGNFGHLGNDGVLWLVLPDNDPDKITPTAPADPGAYQGFSGTADPNNITITANGIALSPTDVVSNANFCVGQYVTFSLGSLPSGTTASNFRWELDGTCYNAHTNAVPGGSMPTSSEVYFLNTNGFNRPEITNIWWTSGGSPAITYTVKLNCTLNFNNGNPPQAFTGTGRFTMYRPKAKISAVTTKVDVNGVRKPYMALVFGDNTGDGITFSNAITIDTNFIGSVEWVQVASSITYTLQDALSDHAFITSNPGPYGDPPIPYATFVDGTPVDSPNQRVGDPYIRATGSGSFTMWMMFQPTGGHSVPLRSVNWYWGGIAAKGPTGWKLESDPGLHSVNPSDAETETYPLWRSLFGAGNGWQFVPPLQ